MIHLGQALVSVAVSLGDQDLGPLELTTMLGQELGCGDEDRASQTGVGELAFLLQRQGAVAVGQRHLRPGEIVLHPDRIGQRTGVGGQLLTGDIDEDVLERRRIVLGAEHPYALHSQSSLGRDLREAGEYEQSVTMLRTVHSLSREHLCPDAVGTLDAQANLASSLRSAGRADEAAGLLEEAYEKLNGRFGPDNPNTLSCRLNRSANLLAMAEVSKALEEMIAVTKAYQKALGTEHPFSLICVNNQSAAWRQRGERRGSWRGARPRAS